MVVLIFVVSFFQTIKIPSISFPILVPFDFTSMKPTFSLILHNIFQSQSSIDFVNNFLVSRLLFNFFVKLVSLILKILQTRLQTVGVK